MSHLAPSPPTAKLSTQVPEFYPSRFSYWQVESLQRPSITADCCSSPRGVVGFQGTLKSSLCILIFEESNHQMKSSNRRGDAGEAKAVQQSPAALGFSEGVHGFPNQLLQDCSFPASPKHTAPRWRKSWRKCILSDWMIFWFCFLWTDGVSQLVSLQEALVITQKTSP